MPQSWKSVTALPALSPDELQIWRITLAAPATPTEPYLHHLTPNEQSRASRLRAGQVRLQFVVARTALRTLLGNLLSAPPKEVPIDTGTHGKPSTPGISFNVAHTSDTILIALCRNSEVGIDVESLTREVDPMEIARHSFAPAESQALADLTNPLDRQRAFFRLWTRKEAVIKADGRGLSLPLDSFEVPLIESAVAVPISIPATPSTPTATYFVSDLYLRDDRAAAFAVKSFDISLSLFEFPFAM